MKECNRCGELKPMTEFYRKTESEDGRQDKCKDCEKLASGNRRSRTGYAGHRGEPDPTRRIRPPIKICRTCANLSHRVVGPKCKECGRLYCAEGARAV